MAARPARGRVTATIVAAGLSLAALAIRASAQQTTAFPPSSLLTPSLSGLDNFALYCAPCHDRTGSGAGMVVRRGYRPPPSFHIDRLRDAPVGHFYDVVTNGFGAMPDYAAQIDVPDRWAIVAYIRALQLSQNAKLSDLPPQERARLEALPVLPSSAPMPTPPPRPFPFSESKPQAAQ